MRGVSELEKKKDKRYIYAYRIIILLFIIICSLVVIVGLKSGVFASVEAFESFIEKSGVFSPILFVILETISVIILIIPCSMGYAVGAAVFGAFWGTVLNAISSFLGSLIIFLVVKKWGQKLLEAFVSEKGLNKYYKLLENQKRFERFFSVMLLLPFTPDNILCYIAGNTKMTTKRYCCIILLFKLWKIIVFCYGVDFFLGFIGF